MGSLGIHTTLRSPHLSALLAGAPLFAHLLSRFLRAQPVWTRSALWALPSLGVGLLFWEPAGYRIRQLLVQLFNWHVGFVSTPGSSYSFLPAPFYGLTYLLEWTETGQMNGTLLLGMGQAVLHYLFEPFPWNISNWFQWFVYPQLIVWYALFPFSLMGFVLAFRKNRAGALALVLAATGLTVVNALASGNIGTVFRHRDMVTPLFLILGCAGFYDVARKRSYAQGSLLLTQLTRLAERLRTVPGGVLHRAADALRSGPLGESWRTEPLRCVGLILLAALATHGVLLPVLGQTVGGWGWNARLIFGTIALLALSHRGDGKRVIRGSWFLQRLREA